MNQIVISKSKDELAPSSREDPQLHLHHLHVFDDCLAIDRDGTSCISMHFGLRNFVVIPAAKSGSGWPTKCPACFKTGQAPLKKTEDLFALRSYMLKTSRNAFRNKDLLGRTWLDGTLLGRSRQAKNRRFVLWLKVPCCNQLPLANLQRFN